MTILKYIDEILFLLGDDKRKLPFQIILFLLASILDLIGIGLIAPFLSLLMDDKNEIVSKYMLIFNSTNIPKEKLLFYIGVFLVFIFGIKSVLRVLINWVIHSFAQKQQVRLKTLLVKKYLNQNYLDYAKKNSADLVHNIHMLTVQYSNGVILNLLNLISEIIVVIVVIIFLAFQNLLALMLSIVLFGSVVALYILFFSKKVKMYGKNTNKAASEILKRVSEITYGFKEIKVLNKENYFLDKIIKNSMQFARNNLKQAIISNVPRYLIEFVAVTFLVFFVFLQIYLGNNPKETIPVIGTFAMAAMRLIPSLNLITSNFTRLRFYRDSVHRLYSELKNLKKYESDAECKIKNSKFESAKFENISFSYDSSKKILNNVTLEIKKGDMVGIVGESGAGKTSLIDIILGLIKPEKGIIYFNNEKINDIFKCWDNKVAYIPQNILLIDDTIAKNIALDDKIDKSRLIKALQQAKLYDFVNSLPNGINTYIGERGVRLSGGQKQRIALARAFYHDRDIIVMDEATSALDVETEKEIIEEISSLKGKKTIIIITHRWSSLYSCDVVYKLENGKLQRINLYMGKRR